MDAPAPPAVKLSELVATLSLVADLGMGRPVERVLRQTVIAMRLADAAGVDPEVRAATFYTSLLTWVGCAADTSELADLFGDETQFYADSHDDDLVGMTMARFVIDHLGRGTPVTHRLSLVGRFLATAGRSVQQVMQNHCRSAGELADRLGLGPDVHAPLLQAFERWDGKGVPGEAGAADLALTIRLVQLADHLEAFQHSAGAPAALDEARRRRGTQFDPELVDVACERSDEILDGVDALVAWEEVISLDPGLGAELTDEGLDVALAALGDFADLKSPTFLGHSRGVAALTAEAATTLGLNDTDVTLLRRAGHVHDLGVIGVPSGTWCHPGPWSLGQSERARTHPYLTERTLSRTPTLAAIGRCAALHHERLDGSGYPRGLDATSIPIGPRVLAAADVCQALGSDRPHRPALAPADAAEVLRDEVRAGRLDGDAVDAVLRADGHRIRRRPALPGGLTPREAEVLVALAGGRSNPEIAEELTISRKTVSAHLEHIYAKLGVSTRTEAALYATRVGLVGDPAGPG